MIDGVTNADSIPVLERMMQFAGARHRLLVHDIANLDTPDFRPVVVSSRVGRSPGPPSGVESHMCAFSGSVR